MREIARGSWNTNNNVIRGTYNSKKNQINDPL